MASGLESAGERAAVKWEVGPTRDVVQALIQTLVDPRLPFTVSIDDPLFGDAQKSVARQMHAVVLLYNYYHRKQKLELEILDFVSFCKLAVKLRPPLIPFMKMIDGNELVGLNSAEDQLSVTEKAIKDACHVAMSLDASKDAPNIEGCPISKVAVLLINSKKENCLLQYGAVTEGVWSLFEKEINEPSVSQEILGEEQACKKRKTNNHQASNDDSKLLQLGYDAVMGVTGVDSSDLVVLETNVVYSLSKEKSAARFYMMQCPQPFNINQSVPLKFLVERLHGPLADKFFDSWSTTPLVEYFQMLPYVGFISDWLSRKDSCLQTLNGNSARNTKNHDEKELPQSTIPSLPLSEHMDTSSSETKISSSKDYQKKNKHSSGGQTASYVEFFQSTKRHRNVMDELKNRSDILNSAKNDACDIVDKDCEKHERGSSSGPPRGMSQSMVRDDNVTQRTIPGDLTRSSFKSEEGKKLNSKIGAHHQKRENISSSHGPEDGLDLNVEKGDLLKSNGSLSRDKKITSENGDVAKSCNQTEKAPGQLEALHNIEVGNVQASEDLQNALALLHRKRQELYSEICTMEDELARYERNIERIRDGGEVDLARKCIKSILSGRNEVEVLDKGRQPDEDQSNPQSETKTKIFCTFLPGKSSYQDLEYICLKNNWRLPRFFVRPSDDKFVSNVVVQGKDFNISSKGGAEASPSEARESAAAQMIAKIRDTCASTCDQTE